MRVGSEGVGGMPHGASGGRVDAKTGMHGGAPAGGFTQLLAILQGFASESASDPAGTGDDVDDGSVDGDGERVDDGTSSPSGAEAANAAQIAAGVVVTLSGAHPAVAVPAAGAASGASGQSGHASGEAAHGGDASGLTGANLAAQASSIMLGKVAAGMSVATPPAVGAAGAKASAATSGARAAGSAAEHAATQGDAATAQGPVAQRGRFMLPTAPTPADSKPDKATRDPAGQTAPPSPPRLARPAIALAGDDGDDAHEHAQDDSAAGGDAGGAPTTQRPALPGVIKSASEATADGTSAATPAPGARPTPHDQGAAVRELQGVGNPAAAEQAVPRASVASGAVPGLPSWIERLASAQQLAASRRGDALHFDLEPNGLGRIEVRLSFGRDGVRAQVFAEHEHTRSLLSNQQTQLAAAFERNDVRLTSFLVDLGLGGEGGRDTRHDPTDVNAFDETGLVSAADGEEAVAAPAPVTGLLSVRA